MEGDQLIINGTSAKRGDLPWHAAIYDKTKSPYEQICGGSLISKTLVISAAHCFWTDLEKQLPARNFAAVLGKLYRPWNDPNEVDVQKSDVREIKLPPRFRGAASSFQEDLALLVLGTPVEYRSYVLPDGKASPVLKVAELPFLDVDRCYADSPPSFYKFITADKFCAGSSNSPALCKGDSGGGLVFASYDRGEERYFLRGVVSTAPNSGDHACNAFVHTTFTQISKHQAFILEHWN
ncbi:Hemolymph protein 14 [Operophtera brumata]|uniref:Hemolymph protein 14 n=1 Tax=Operophtera brumata TaxID=104452 RepID=A0A0L7LN32_OPEBR|nr:Hemolymph protein 14 [Operophtera brumata]